MPDRPYNVLFLCTGNSARSIIAEVLLNKLGAGKFKAYSAGSQPKGRVNPTALQLLKRLGYDTSTLRSKSWDEFAKPDAPKFDFIFTLCDDAAGEECPVWPGKPLTAHWGIPDPAAVQGSPAEISLAFNETARMLSQRIGVFAAPSYRQVRRGFATGWTPGDRADGGRNDKGEGRKLTPSLAQRATAEGLGTAFLLATVVGSGVMAFKLAGGNGAIALLCNTIPTGAILTVLILIFGPVSGAHFNPAVSVAFAIRRELPASDAFACIASQIVGAIVGVWMAHLMFELPVWQFSMTVRTGWGQWLAEGVATFGLLLTIFGCLAFSSDAIPYAVGLYITAAYWFTASTSFANPAVTIGRALSDTFAGIAPGGVLAFIVAQLIGKLLAIVLAGWIFDNGHIGPDRLS